MSLEKCRNSRIALYSDVKTNKLHIITYNSVNYYLRPSKLRLKISLNLDFL